MGLLDKAKDLLGQHEEKVEDALDKVADVVDDKTGGKYADKIEKFVHVGAALTAIRLPAASQRWNANSWAAITPPAKA